ncbi:hypothetical protein PybrP1_005589 [[Pythium] brassicae (nom. inval.)]|nr:hypothetical protein PybrP1_005589 [[Pythium] brassicae (nom. inval.)]
MPSKRRIIELDTSDDDAPMAREAGAGDEKRKRSAVSLQSPVFEGVFASWTEFDEAFADYQHASSQMYHLRTSVSVATRNKDRKLKASTWGTKFVVFDEAMGTYYRKFICIHG